MEVGSRVVYGGFWVLVAAVAGVGGIAMLGNGQGAGLLVAAVGVGAALYARYIFKGGRFRILFW